MIEKLVPFDQVKVSFSRKKLIRLFYNHSLLNFEDAVKMRRKLAQIEQAINQLKHAQSVVERILDRAG